MGRKPSSEQDPLILAQVNLAARAIEDELTARSLAYTDVDKAIKGGNAFHAAFLGDGGAGLPRIKSALWPRLARALTLDLAVIGGKEWARMQPNVNCADVVVLPTVKSKRLSFGEPPAKPAETPATPTPAVRTHPVVGVGARGHIMPDPPANPPSPAPVSEPDHIALAEGVLLDALRQLKALPRVESKTEQQLEAAQKLNDTLARENTSLHAALADRDAKIKAQTKEIEALREEVESYRQAAKAFMGSIPPATAKLLANA